jgi:hypothetical protein
MGKWTRRRKILRYVGGALTGAAIGIGGGWISGVLGAVGAGLTMLSIDLPRDPWSRKDIEKAEWKQK